MSTMYTVVCRTCKKRLPCPGYSSKYLEQTIADWARYKHLTHDIAVFHDVTGWDEDYDKEYDEIMEYEEVTHEEENEDG